MRQINVSNPTTGTIDEAFEYVEAAPEPNRHYSDNAEVITVGTGCKCFAKLNSSDSGRFAYYYNDTWNYGQGTCLTT